MVHIRFGAFQGGNTQTETTKPTVKGKPIHEVRIGPVKAAIWRNDASDGVRCNSTFSRLFKDKEDQRWKSTDSFGRDDLLVLAKVADTAHTWIFAQTQEKEGHPQA